MNDMFAKIEKLKKDRNAVILAHYYQDPDIQDVADFMGDSLALAQYAKNTDADVILFCGVHFMCETAKILNPDKVVILPDLDAGCSLADSAPFEEFQAWINAHPQHTVISYINCSADVKGMSDIICTSSNAEKIINSLPEDEKIIFAPDKFLGSYLNKKTNRDMLLWNGSCQVHEIFSEKELVKLKTRFPQALVLAHPECDENILQHAHQIGSTTSIINFAKNNDAEQFVVVTEPGVIHQMKKQSPQKEFIPLPSNDGCACNECPHMRLNTLEKMVNALETLTPQINMSDVKRQKALKPLERMLELS
jgi:quinolinate synthase